MKIYTKTGDAGETALFGGGRVGKDHARVMTYGTVDELNASIGWAVTQVVDSEIRERLRLLQQPVLHLRPVSEGNHPGLGLDRTRSRPPQQ